MSWLRVDDGMVDHRKWATLEGDPRAWSECLAVWLALACYCARTLSDGYVEEARVARLTPLGARARARCDDMVKAGLMTREEGGYRFHDWHAYQASRQEVEAKREAKTRRQREWRHRVDASRDTPVDASTSRLVDASRDAPVERAPSHPIPSHPSLSSERDRARDGESPTAGYERVRLALVAAYKAAGAMVPTRDLGIPHSSLLMSLSDAFAGDEAAMRETFMGFFADERAKAAGHPLSWLAKNPNQYRARPGNADSRPGKAPRRQLPADLHDAERSVIGRALEGRWWPPGSKLDRVYRDLVARHPGICPPPPHESGVSA